MGLVGNFVRLQGSVGRVFTVNSPPVRGVGEWANWIRQAGRTTALNTASYPTGYVAGASYLPTKGGEVSWRAFGTSTLSASALSGRLMIVALSGTGAATFNRTAVHNRLAALSGSGALGVNMVGLAPLVVAFVGSGDLDATATGIVLLVVPLTGSGDLDATISGLSQMILAVIGAGDLDASMVGLAPMVIAFTGAGDIDLDMLGRFAMAVSLTGAGDLDATAFGTAHPEVAMAGAGDLDALIAAFGDMNIDIVVTGSGLSTANVGSAVWSALAAANNTSGTMGEKLNDAGSAGNPWNSVIESGLTAEHVLRIIAAAVAGASSGAPDGPIEFMGLDGVTVRITGDVDDDGNRSNVVLDGS